MLPPTAHTNASHANLEISPPCQHPGRRRLANLEELVARCDGWRPPPPYTGMRLSCRPHNFGVGLVRSLGVLQASSATGSACTCTRTCPCPCPCPCTCPCPCPAAGERFHWSHRTATPCFQPTTPYLQPASRRLQPASRRLQPVTRRLQASDVMVTSHGADMINAFALHRGASVFEVMPVYQAGRI